MRKDLDNIYSKFNEKKLSSIQERINKINYFSQLESLEPMNNAVDQFMKSLENKLIDSHYNTALLRFDYVENRLDDFDFSTMENHSEVSTRSSVRNFKVASFEDNREDLN